MFRGGVGDGHVYVRVCVNVRLHVRVHVREHVLLNVHVRVHVRIRVLTTMRERPMEVMWKERVMFTIAPVLGGGSTLV